MKIIADSEGSNVIRQLCDIALKSGGLQNLQGIVQILNSLQVDTPKSVGLSSTVPNIKKES